MPSRRANSISRRRGSTRRSSSTAAPFRRIRGSARRVCGWATLTLQNGDGPNALREYVRAAELLPDDEDAQLKAAKFMLLAGSVCRCQGAWRTDAGQIAEERRGAGPDRERAGRSEGLRDSAVDAFEKAAQLDPSRSTTYSELGAAQMAKGDPVAAEAAFRKAVEINPKSPLALIEPRQLRVVERRCRIKPRRC